MTYFKNQTPKWKRTKTSEHCAWTNLTQLNLIPLEVIAMVSMQQSDHGHDCSCNHYHCNDQSDRYNHDHPHCHYDSCACHYDDCCDEKKHCKHMDHGHDHIYHSNGKKSDKKVMHVDCRNSCSWSHNHSNYEKPILPTTNQTADITCLAVTLAAPWAAACLPTVSWTTRLCILAPIAVQATQKMESLNLAAFPGMTCPSASK